MWELRIREEPEGFPLLPETLVSLASDESLERLQETMKGLAESHEDAWQRTEAFSEDNQQYRPVSPLERCWSSASTWYVNTRFRNEESSWRTRRTAANSSILVRYLSLLLSSPS